MQQTRDGCARAEERASTGGWLSARRRGAAPPPPPQRLLSVQRGGGAGPPSPPPWRPHPPPPHHSSPTQPPLPPPPAAMAAACERVGGGGGMRRRRGAGALGPVKRSSSRAAPMRRRRPPHACHPTAPPLSPLVHPPAHRKHRARDGRRGAYTTPRPPGAAARRLQGLCRLGRAQGSPPRGLPPPGSAHVHGQQARGGGEGGARANRPSFPAARRHAVNPPLTPSPPPPLPACPIHRVHPERLLGLGLGEAEVIRNGGGRVTEDVFRCERVGSAWSDACTYARGPPPPPPTHTHTHTGHCLCVKRC